MYGKVEEGLDQAGVPTMRVSCANITTVKPLITADPNTLKVMGAVDVKHTQEHELTLEWDSSASNDMIADSCLALILEIDKSPASVKRKIHVASRERRQFMFISNHNSHHAQPQP